MYQRPEPIVVPITLARALQRDLAELEQQLRELQGLERDKAVLELATFQQAQWPAIRDLLVLIDEVIPTTDERPKGAS